VISIGIDLFGLHAAAKTDHVGQVHMRAVLGRGGFEEPGVSDPICDRVDLQHVRWIPTSWAAWAAWSRAA
jgi:hypothetical protein